MHVVICDNNARLRSFLIASVRRLAENAAVPVRIDALPSAHRLRFDYFDAAFSPDMIILGPHVDGRYFRRETLMAKYAPSSFLRRSGFRDFEIGRWLRVQGFFGVILHMQGSNEYAIDEYDAYAFECARGGERSSQRPYGVWTLDAAFEATVRIMTIVKRSVCSFRALRSM